MKIIQITALPNTGEGDTIYGLSNDGVVYWWDARVARWELAKTDESDEE